MLTGDIIYFVVREMLPFLTTRNVELADCPFIHFSPSLTVSLLLSLHQSESLTGTHPLTQNLLIHFLGPSSKLFPLLALPPDVRQPFSLSISLPPNPSLLRSLRDRLVSFSCSRSFKISQASTLIFYFESLCTLELLAHTRVRRSSSRLFRLHSHLLSSALFRSIRLYSMYHIVCLNI
jgi:hypothetical protein